MFCIWMAPPLVLLAIALMQPFAPFEALSRDPLAYAEQAEACCKAYYGALSNLGVMLWTFAGAACVVAGVVFSIRRPGGVADPHACKHAARYFFAAGLLSTIFAIDDMFLVHETVGPYIGVPEAYVLGGYALLAMAFVLRFFKRIFSFSPLFFSMAVMLLGTSFAIDFADDQFGLGGSLKAEDSAKFMGISAWTAYFFRSAYRALASSLETPAP